MVLSFHDKNGHFFLGILDEHIDYVFTFGLCYYIGNSSNHLTSSYCDKLSRLNGKLFPQLLRLRKCKMTIVFERDFFFRNLQYCSNW